MHGSAAVGWLLTALCAVTGAACLLRARGAGGMQRSAARSEALMGLGMAAMALSGSVSTAAVPPLVFIVLFGAVGAWELLLLRETRQQGRGPGSEWGPGPGPGPGRRARQGAAHRLHHLVGALAMVYMALAMQGAHGGAPAGHVHAGTTAAGLPLLTGALLAYFAVYVLRTGLRLAPVRADAAGAGGRGVGGTGGGLSGTGTDAGAAVRHCGGCAARDLPGLATACRLAMATGMLAMLLTL
ncbi:MAG TPA: DUF5134 domain-containing protein [Streptomyces sp.]|nr:DUF5134 domain-containing protein [Streptomyces sp.]